MRSMFAGLDPSVFAAGTLNCSVTSSPRRSTAKSAGAAGTLISGGNGARRFPHAAIARTTATRHANRDPRTLRVLRTLCVLRKRRALHDPGALLNPTSTAPSTTLDGSSCRSKNVPGQVFILHDLGEHRVHVGRVDRDVLVGQVRAFERNLVEQLLHHRVKAAGADVLGPVVHDRRKVGDALDRVVGEPD